MRRSDPNIACVLGIAVNGVDLDAMLLVADGHARERAEKRLAERDGLSPQDARARVRKMLELWPE